MILRTITEAECELVRQWRNAPDVLPMLRTGAKTVEEQAAFYRNVIQNPQELHRYYALEVDGAFVGMGGLTYFDRVPGEAEISLLLAPHARGCGFGAMAVDALLTRAWSLGLTTVIGECYRTGAIGFWHEQIRRYRTMLNMDVWVDVVSEGDAHGVRSCHAGTLHWRWTRREAA